MSDVALLAVQILAKFSAPAFKLAYKRCTSIWKAKEGLEQLRRTIQSIEAALPDAKKREEGSAEVKHWLERTKEVLYKADDLFDEVATNALLEQQKGSTILTKVLVFVSKLIPFTSNDSLAKKVKAIRKDLRQVYDDMAPFKFVEREYERSMPSLRRDTGWYVEPTHVFGRDDDKEAIRRFLLDDTNAEQSVSVIAIVAREGMGKSTLAQLVYSDDSIRRSFGKRWWTWISRTREDTEDIGKIFHSMTGESYHNVSRGQLESRIRESISINLESVSTSEECTVINERFLLVLDDFCEKDHARAMKLRSLFCSANAKGSKILVTASSSLVAQAIEADEIYNLGALSLDASWDLFKMFAFNRERENDQTFISHGKNILPKCENNPLAIKSVASLLYTKDTCEEWKNIEEKELSKIELTDDSIMSALKLSYDDLPSHLKQCFAYIAVFPKGRRFCKEELVYLWIAHGYVKQEGYETVEAAGDVCFLELIRRSFLQEVDQYQRVDDEVVTLKLYILPSLMHDLAQRVGGHEFIVLTETPTEFHNETRHLSLAYGIDDSSNIPQEWLSCSGLHSFLSNCEGSLGSKLLDQLSEKCKVLRALNLQNQKIEKISSSIGEFKLLRYLNLSRNPFIYLPKSITMLVNLQTLDISFCKNLEALPIGFWKLTSLIYLENRNCDRLRHMPPRFGELSSLRHLSYFMVSKSVSGGKCSSLDALATLKLTGELMIRFDDGIKDWNGDECWRLPSTIQALAIDNYQDMRMPHWGLPMPNTTSLLSKLVKLQVSKSSAIQYLPSFRDLPVLKALELSGLDQLEYVQEADSVGSQSGVAISPIISHPCLEEITLCELPKLKFWWGTPYLDHQMSSFPCLSSLKVKHCESLTSMPLSPCIQTLELDMINEDLMQRLLVSTTTPSTLKTVVIWGCKGLKKFPGEALTSLQFLELKYCNNLQRLFLALSPLDVLEELVIQNCPQLVLWGEESKVVWDSLPNLRVLLLDEIPDDERLPGCLRVLQSDGKLKIKKQQ